MHIVPTSPWPFVTSVSVMFLLLTTVNFFRYLSNSANVVVLCLVFFVLSIILWCSDVTFEGAIIRMHTILMQRSLRFAIILFILSEVMFFFHFFDHFFITACHLLCLFMAFDLQLVFRQLVRGVFPFLILLFYCPLV